ncbi:hypothetical protein OIU84_016591 [Salix udensis]|uniref:F-box/LRR-repeat protein 15-like leucin rich repeat domain-containing protein n=1 Tax=Salix udensis TaxID=889485 RepID=A0AAD6JAP4_9ROSI|nr:hypothetical protein OIU84_016591 [Salix udensis]
MASSSMAMAATMNDLPDVILSIIFSSVSDTRTRNSLSLVNRKFLALERSTRTSLTLRGRARDIYTIPTCFRSVTHLDLSLLSPWGRSDLLSSTSSDSFLLAHRLRLAFPLVTSLTVYARSPSTLHILLPQWPGLSHVKLIRWHQRPQSPHLGNDLVPLFAYCQALSSIDLSSFYYWTEDIPPVLQAYPSVSKSLKCLDLLTASLTDGFRSEEIQAITAACPSLTKLLLVCVFNPSYFGCVGDETLLAIVANCPKLRVLHLVDRASLGSTRGEPEDDGYTRDDARISKNVRDSALALEALPSKCPELKLLKLGHFHGICMAIESQLDGVALCSGLVSLTIKNSADLTDMGLIEIGRGCCKLAKFEVEGCKKITMKGMRTMASLLHKTLIEVKISCCKNLDAAASLRSLEPIQGRIERLHLDCVWEGLGEDGGSLCFDLNGDLCQSFEHEHGSRRKKSRYSSDPDPSSYCMQSNGNGMFNKSWDRLKYLSLWIGAGVLLTPLPTAGLYDCPNLEEIRIKVEGDCRTGHKPSQREFGLSCLAYYPRLSKMQLDCSDTIGFALTAPSGQMDLTLWERFFLNGIGNLSLYEVDYWPPQDRDVNQRSLTLPGAGLLAECLAVRKLFIHGTAHEHFIMFLLRIPNLRDVQLREDYYPAPRE